MKKLQLLSVIFLLLSALTFAQTVYVTNTGKKYHKSSCSYLSKSKISISLEDAKSSGYTPCKRCKPQTSTSYQKSETQKESKSSSTSEKKEISKSRCIATTKQGEQCKRNAKDGSNYCWQHEK